MANGAPRRMNMEWRCNLIIRKPVPRRGNDGVPAPQVLLPGQFLLCSGQDRESRATTLRLLRQAKWQIYQSHDDPETRVRWSKWERN